MVPREELDHKPLPAHPRRPFSSRLLRTKFQQGPRPIPAAYHLRNHSTHFSGILKIHRCGPQSDARATVCRLIFLSRSRIATREQGLTVQPYRRLPHLRAVARRRPVGGTVYPTGQYCHREPAAANYSILAGSQIVAPIYRSGPFSLFQK